MNSPIFTKYWTALLELGIASETDSAIALALRLVIDEAGQTNTTSAETAREDYRRLRNEIDGLRQQLAQLDANNADLTRKLAALHSVKVAT